MQMLATGISFKTAPVNVREAVSFSGSDLSDSLLKLSFYEGINELVILSTCNRTEFYIITSDLDLAKASIIKFLEKEKKVNFSDLSPYFYNYYNKFAAEHLYRVVSGVDSLILGEGEILYQLKDAFSKAMEVGSSGKIFNALFRFALETGKKVRTETTISQRPTSAGSVAVKLARETFGNLGEKTALLIGAGKISQITAKNLKEHNIGNLVIVNRTYEKAKAMADELNGTAVSFENIDSAIKEADITIVCTGAPEYIVTKNNCPDEKTSLLIDLSIPRNIDPEISNRKNIKLYDIDCLERVANINKEERAEIIQEVECIIKEEMSKFVEWYNALDVSPVISSISSLFEEIRENEVSRTTKKYKLSESEKKIVDIVTKSIVQKILYYPVTSLKMTEDKSLKRRYIEDLKHLFRLDLQGTYQKYYNKKESSKENLEKVFHNDTVPITAEVLSKNMPINNTGEKQKFTCPFAKIQ